MDRDTIEMAQEAQISDTTIEFYKEELNALVALVRADERNKLAAWMTQFGFATGHGDTMEQLCDALGTEIVDRIDGEVEAERETLLDIAYSYADSLSWNDEFQEAIKARGETK